MWFTGTWCCKLLVTWPPIVTHKRSLLLTSRLQALAVKWERESIGLGRPGPFLWVSRCRKRLCVGGGISVFGGIPALLGINF